VDADSGLFARLRERDVSAFEMVYERYYRMVFGVAQRVLADQSAAEDVAQAVFLTLWTAPSSYRDGNFAGWLARCARNRALDVLRSKARRTTDELPADVPLDGSVDDLVFATLDGDRVRGALAALPPEQRVPIELGFFGGVTHEEMARRLDLPLGTLKTRIRTGLRRLRSELEALVQR
jgi:RNA polymerase sigma-70 factor (ECF subfamily)